jgi:hypothetical protein
MYLKSSESAFIQINNNNNNNNNNDNNNKEVNRLKEKNINMV